MSYSFAQNYEQIAKAEEFVSKKDFCNTYETFKPLLIDSNQGSIYDYYYASLSAVNCKKDEDALNWLNVAAEKGLGLKDGEIDCIKKDESFKELKSTEKWASIINTMQNKFADKKLIEKLYEGVYDNLGEETLLTWYEEFPKKYSIENIKKMRR